jgi:dephospho-CoA kinase
MVIPDNIVTKKLKNIFFVIGGSCSGKTTLAKYLNEKYGMYHYDTDYMVKTFYETASIDYQPTLCRKMNDIF